MAARRTQEPFAEYVRRLTKKRQPNVKTLAELAGVDRGHLYRVLHAKQGKIATPELTARVAVALGLPEDFFPEYREAVVVARLREDSELRERLYDDIH